MASRTDSKDMLILKHLRENSNQPLTDIARLTGIPVTTIYDRMRQQEQSIIRRYTVLLDFMKLGYHTRTKIALKVSKNDKDALRDFLLAHKSLNSLYRINMGYDYLIESVFRDAKEAYAFVDELEERFRISEKHIFFVVEEVERERFLSK